MPGILDVQKLERLIELAQNEYDRVEYIWHGGEPLLCGLNYFEQIVQLQEKYRQTTSIIENSIQTNGSLINDDFINFFKHNNFDISVSLDGPGDCNCLRHHTAVVLKNIQKLQEASVHTSTISVIHALNVEHQIEMYEFFKSMNLSMKFNPIFQSGSANENQEYLLDLDQYIKSLKKLYDYWLLDKTAVKVDPIEQYLSLVLRGRGIDCIYGSCLGHWIGIDHEGDIYPCGRSYPKDYKLSNILEINNLHEAFETASFERILKETIIRRSKCQASCEYFGFCNGGCNNNAILEHQSLMENGGFLCEVLKEMVVYVRSSIETIRNSNDAQKYYNPIIQEKIQNSIKLKQNRN